MANDYTGLITETTLLGNVMSEVVFVAYYLWLLRLWPSVRIPTDARLMCHAGNGIPEGQVSANNSTFLTSFLMQR
jgi:hypothetical protein